MLKTSTDPIKVEEFFRIEENHFVLACAVFSAYVKDMLPKFQKFSSQQIVPLLVHISLYFVHIIMRKVN